MKRLIVFMVFLTILSCGDSSAGRIVDVVYSPQIEVGLEEIIDSVSFERIADPQKDGGVIYPISRYFELGDKRVIFEKRGVSESRLHIVNTLENRVKCILEYIDDVPSEYRVITDVDVYEGEVYVLWYDDSKIRVYDENCVFSRYLDLPFREILYFKMLSKDEYVFDVADGGEFNNGYQVGVYNSVNDHIVRYLPQKELPFGRRSGLSGDEGQVTFTSPLSSMIYRINSKGIGEVVSLDFGDHFLSLEQFKSPEQLLKYVNDGRGIYEINAFYDFSNYYIAFIHPAFSDVRWIFIRKSDLKAITLTVHADRLTGIKIDDQIPLGASAKCLRFIVESEVVRDRFNDSFDAEAKGLIDWFPNGRNMASNPFVSHVYIDWDKIDKLFAER